MYNEQRSFSMKNVILQFLFLALFIFILIWLFPLKSDLKNAINGIEKNDLSVLTDRIFNENIIAMKESAKSYYTNARLPKNVGDKVKITLGEMLDKKIILPFKDKNGDACDLTESYVEITKYDDEFIMKVNLKCGSEENYLLVYMGCYDYCSTEICEKNPTDVKSPTVYSSKPSTSTPVINNIINNVINNVINNNNNNNNNNGGEKPTPTPNPTPEEKEYLWEYKKVTDGYYTETDWSAWSTTAVSASSTRAVQIKTVTEKKLIGYNVTKKTDYNKPIYENKAMTIGSETILVCNKWEWISDGTATKYNGEWVYAETVTLSSPPTSTSTVKYEFVGFKNEMCKETCSSSSKFVYKKYVVGSSAVDLQKYACTSSSLQTTPITTIVQTIVGYEKVETSREPVYENVSTKYYRYKTRTYVVGTTDIKWSSWNDTTLLTVGYKYTGNKKQK